MKTKMVLLRRHSVEPFFGSIWHLHSSVCRGWKEEFGLTEGWTRLNMNGLAGVLPGGVRESSCFQTRGSFRAGQVRPHSDQPRGEQTSPGGGLAFHPREPRRTDSQWDPRVLPDAEPPARRSPHTTWLSWRHGPDELEKRLFSSAGRSGGHYSMECLPPGGGGGADESVCLSVFS